MPSSRAAQKAFLSALPPHIKHIYELGSGWGGIAFAAARACPTATIHAFELSWAPWFFSCCVRIACRYHNVRIYRKNFFSCSLREADVVVCYLYPGAMRKLSPLCEKSLKPGALILSNSFALPGWTPQAVIPVDDFWKSEIYIYGMPAADARQE